MEDVELHYKNTCTLLMDAEESGIMQWGEENEWHLYWDTMIGIPKCRQFIKKYALTIFNSTPSKFTTLLSTKEGVWNSFYELEIIQEINFFLMNSTKRLPFKIIFRNIIEEY